MWNPALAGNCNGLWSGYWYCVADFGTAPPLPPVVTTTPSPIGTGSPSNCADWYNATLGDNCDTVVAQFGTFSKSDFISWNPSVWSDCSNFQVSETKTERVHSPTCSSVYSHSPYVLRLASTTAWLSRGRQQHAPRRFLRHSQPHCPLKAEWSQTAPISGSSAVVTHATPSRQLTESPWTISSLGIPPSGATPHASSLRIATSVLV